MFLSGKYLLWSINIQYENNHIFWLAAIHNYAPRFQTIFQGRYQNCHIIWSTSIYAASAKNIWPDLEDLELNVSIWVLVDAPFRYILSLVFRTDFWGIKHLQIKGRPHYRGHRGEQNWSPCRNSYLQEEIQRRRMQEGQQEENSQEKEVQTCLKTFICLHI